MKRRFVALLACALLVCPMLGCGANQPAVEQTDQSQTETDAGSDAAKLPSLSGTVWAARTQGGDVQYRLEFTTDDVCYLVHMDNGGWSAVQKIGYRMEDGQPVLDEPFRAVVMGGDQSISIAFPDGSSQTFVTLDDDLSKQEDLDSLLDIVGPIWDESGKATAAPQKEAQTATQPTSQADDQVVDTACVRIVMPGMWVDKGLAWIDYGDHVVLEYALNGDRVQLASVDWDERSSLPYEADDELWTVGESTYQGRSCSVVLHVMYVNAEGKTYYAGIDEPNATLASEYFVDLSAEEILSWLQLVEAQAAEEPAQDEAGQSGRTEDGLSLRTKPFWGVWVYASKDLTEAATYAGDLAWEGFDGAAVFMTTDWANLNSEPWYVVSLGACESEGEADALVNRAWNSGYGDAYVKESGSYIG